MLYSKKEIQINILQYEKLYNEIGINTIPIKVFSGGDNLISHYKNISSSSESDVFFDFFGVGNIKLGQKNPFERQTAYELLLKILKQIDPLHYHKIHKGTAYYFIGWTTFQYKDYRKAIFYLDAAVSEDLKSPDVHNKRIPKPSLDFFLLKTESNPSGIELHLDLINLIKISISNYIKSSGSTITIDDFRSNFLEDLLYSDAKGRSLLTAFYSFFLENKEIEMQIDLRSDSGGSIQVFLDNLFDGARILESLLEKRGGYGNNLREKITKTPLILVSKKILLPNKTLKDAENQYLKLVKSGYSFQDSNFSSAYIIRHTSAHSLLWPDQFKDGKLYKILFSNLANSIFWTIEKLWIQTSL